MFMMRRAMVLHRNAIIYADLQLQNIKPYFIRSFATDKKDIRKMVDPKHVAHYDDILKVIHQPKKVIIDVRNRDEVDTTGMIPSSINIPLPAVKETLVSMSNEDFRKTYQREKPSENDEIIFYCRSGRRSTEAVDQALKLGYSKSFATDKKDIRKMVDPKHVAHYDDILKVIHQPKKVIIDVRNRDEVDTTGMIPSSINIPLPAVKETLVSMSNEDFRKTYQREKPSENDEIIFYCRSGRRSTEAVDQALKLGYSKSKTYIGSWNEWSSRKR